MGQVLIKNTDDKVIKNVAGNVLRQNFQFGKYFARGPVSAYVRLPFFNSFITRTTEWTVLGWIGDDGTVIPNGMLPFISIVNANVSGAGASLVVGVISNLLEYSKSETVSLFNSLTPLLSQAGFTGARCFIGLYYNGSNSLSYYLNSATKTFWVNPAWAYNFTNVYLGVTNRFGLVSYPRKLDEYLFYNRQLSSSEATYIRNSNLGNEPASLEGLKCWLRFEIAEELDFSVAQDGSDLRAGIRDMSGNNNHADFVNVPAGTNAQRVDYVNTNLLLTW